jgi:hypothetical protein
MYVEPPLLSIEAWDYLKGLISEAAYEAGELVVIHFAVTEDRSSDTRPEGVPDAVALSANGRGPALYPQMCDEQLIPFNPPVLVNLEEEVVRGVQAMACYEFEVSGRKHTLEATSNDTNLKSLHRSDGGVERRGDACELFREIHIHAAIDVRRALGDVGPQVGGGVDGGHQLVPSISAVLAREDQYQSR